MRVLLFLVSLCFATDPDQKNLPIGLAPYEETLVLREAPLTAPPVGPVISLSEWEVSDGVMVLWPNPSLLKALKSNGPVFLFADSSTEKVWWQEWLSTQKMSEEKVEYFITPTDSIWIRDYGPWFILDGNKKFGLVDTKYNRPRPKDDIVPLFLAKELKIPYYQPGLVHTGGNYYNDALGNAFSSTLVFTENSHLPKNTVLDRMLKFLGVERYTTSRLSPATTIQHLDTFGKLVAPDTWVFSDFPTGSIHKTDSDNMVQLLKTLKSPYGTPYKIHRLKMYSSGKSFRAYLNSFISNGVLYYPAYGDSIDKDVEKVYQDALPGYRIVGVDAMGTQWGDSVHCRTRNLLSPNALFLFPRLSHVDMNGVVTVNVSLEAIPPPGAQINEAPVLYWELNGKEQAPQKLEWIEKFNWKLSLRDFKKGDTLRIWFKAKDSKGGERLEPRLAPLQSIELSF